MELRQQLRDLERFGNAVSYAEVDERIHALTEQNRQATAELEILDLAAIERYEQSRRTREQQTMQEMRRVNALLEGEPEDRLEFFPDLLRPVGHAGRLSAAEDDELRRVAASELEPLTPRRRKAEMLERALYSTRLKDRRDEEESSRQRRREADARKGRITDLDEYMASLPPEFEFSRAVIQGRIVAQSPRRAKEFGWDEEEESSDDDDDDDDSGSAEEGGTPVTPSPATRPSTRRNLFPSTPPDSGEKGKGPAEPPSPDYGQSSSSSGINRLPQQEYEPPSSPASSISSLSDGFMEFAQVQDEDDLFDPSDDDDDERGMSYDFSPQVQGARAPTTAPPTPLGREQIRVPAAAGPSREVPQRSQRERRAPIRYTPSS